MAEEDRLVTVAAFSLPHEAHLARLRLDAEGIPCFVVDENIVAINWLYSNAIGGVKVQVPQSFAEQAIAVLEPGASAEPAERQEPETAREDVGQRCPQCGSADVMFQKFSRRIAFLSILFVGVPASVFAKAGPVSELRT